MATEVDPDVERALIETDLQIWRNTQRQCEIRIRVQKKLAKYGDVTEAIGSLQKEMERCEAAIIELEEMLTELPPAKPASNGHHPELNKDLVEEG